MVLDLIILLLLLSNNGEYMIPNMLILYNSPRVLDFQMEQKCRKMKTSGKLVQYS